MQKEELMTIDVMQEPISEDLFWGPFAELRSRQQPRTEEPRSPEQVLATFGEALSALLAKTSIPQFQTLTARKKGPVLQIGCGQGSLLSRLANDGREVTGIDSSAEVLEVARHQLAELPLDIQSHVTLTQTDVTQFDLKRQFSVILLPFFTLALLGKQEQRALIRQIEHHLAPTATLLFEYVIPKGPQTDAIVSDTELLIGGEMVPGSIGLKWLEELEVLILKCSSRAPEGTEAVPQYLKAHRTDH